MFFTPRLTAGAPSVCHLQLHRRILSFRSKTEAIISVALWTVPPCHLASPRHFPQWICSFIPDLQLSDLQRSTMWLLTYFPLLLQTSVKPNVATPSIAGIFIFFLLTYFQICLLQGSFFVQGEIWEGRQISTWFKILKSFEKNWRLTFFPKDVLNALEQFSFRSALHRCLHTDGYLSGWVCRATRIRITCLILMKKQWVSKC